MPQNEFRNQPLILILNRGCFEKVGLSVGLVEVINCPVD